MLALAIALSIGSPIKLSAPDYSDLAPLEKALKGVTLVQIGEATHGAGEFYTLKTRLVKFLHEKMGFDLLMIESGVLESILAERKDAKQLMKSTVFPNFQWKESLPLFEYLVANPKLAYLGVDVQFSSDDFLVALREFLYPFDKELASDVGGHIGDGYKLYGLTSKPEEYAKVQKEHLDWLAATKAKISALRVPGKESARKATLIRVLDQQSLYWDFKPDQLNSSARLQLRDRLMAENADFHMRAFGSRRKAILWTHNGHIGVNPFYRTTGSILAESFKEKSYALGLFAKEGEYYEHWTKQTKPWAAKPEGFEAWVNPAEAVFLDFRANLTPFSKSLAMFEPENGGNTEFVPSKRFDGAIVVRKISAPTPP